MYNKLFTSILDSSVWLEPTPTRIVWVMFLAAMDEDGFVRMASIGNVANRARVSLEEAEEAVKALESPDRVDPEQEHEGRRIERVSGGWMVINSAKYRDIVKRENEKEMIRQRVARHRKRKADVTVCNDVKRNSNAQVTQSDTDTEANTEVGSTPLPPTPPNFASLSGKERPPNHEPLTNKPTLIHALDYFRTRGYARTEVEAAYRTFEAAKDADGAWYWGKRLVGDWRAAMEQRMAEARQRSPAGRPAKTAAEVLDEIGREVRRECENDPGPKFEE